MEITTELVKHLAELSRLEFNDEQTEKFKAEFQKTLEQMEQLNKLNTTNVQLKQDNLNAETQLKVDEPKQSLTKEEVIKNAPENMGNSIAVPMMVD